VLRPLCDFSSRLHSIAERLLWQFFQDAGAEGCKFNRGAQTHPGAPQERRGSIESIVLLPSSLGGSAAPRSRGQTYPRTLQGRRRY